jgi:hypothetical protein
METGLLVLVSLGLVPVIVKFLADILEKIGLPINRSARERITDKTH